MGKRGPKRKAGKRLSSGRLNYRANNIAPAAELIAKRIGALSIAGVAPTDKIDHNLASCWHGVLFAARIINQSQYDAGNHYHLLYKACLPQGFPGSVLDPDALWLNNQIVQPYEVFKCPDEVVAAWEASEAVLAAIDSKTHVLVKNICVYGRFEQFIDVSSPRPTEAWRADAQNRTRFQCGLDALALAYGFKAARQEKRQAALNGL